MEFDEFLRNFCNPLGDNDKFTHTYIKPNCVIDEIGYCTFRITIKDIHKHGLDAVAFFNGENTYINGLAAETILVSLEPFVFIVQPD